MELVEVEKKGGPYTKKEQEERRDEVFRLHFEHGYSALKISELMKINRNTINEDIKHLYSQVTSEFDGSEKRSWAIKQLHRLETQRDRLLADLETQKILRDKINIEKMIYDIDSKITNIVINTIPYIDDIDEPNNESENTDKNEIKEIIPNFLKPKNDLIDWSYTKDEILYDIIKLKKCNLSHAETLFENMKKLGLELCENDSDYPEDYDMSRFSILRGYISEEEFTKIRSDVEEKVLKKNKESARRYGKLLRKLAKKYGSDKSKWPNEAKEELDSFSFDED